MHFAQKVIIFLNLPIITPFLHQIYALGLRAVVSRLSRIPAVHSIYGSGSFFKQSCLYGYSDIDLIIAIKPEFLRNDGTVEEIRRAYQRSRLFFPFLGRWEEKLENLILLGEVKDGFPLLESFRIRLAENRLTLLYGEPLELSSAHKKVTISSLLPEVNTLLRSCALHGTGYGWRRLFWKRMFLKLIDVEKSLGLREIQDSIASYPELEFLTEKDRTLYFQKADSERLFSLMTDFVTKIYSAVSEREKLTTVEYRRFSVESSSAKPQQELSLSKRMLSILQHADISTTCVQTTFPPLLTIPPHLFYFRLDEPIVVVEVVEAELSKLDQLKYSLERFGETGDALLVHCRSLYFVATRQQQYVDIIPADPLTSACLYANLKGKTSFQMPALLYEAERELAARLFAALKTNYARHEGYITKLPFPCVYMEDDLFTMTQAFHIIRAFLACSDFRIVVESIEDLIAFLTEQFPKSGRFLAQLCVFYHYLLGKSEERPGANNLYRTLHTFMVALLNKESDISVDSLIHRKIGITVGIITRNRSQDLAEMLHSLTKQTRAPDEIVLVDNGSTDKTHQVVQSFVDQLPLRYISLKQPSIPEARNLVLKEATQEVVSFTDDDCLCDPDWLWSVERGFVRADNVGIVGGWVMHEPSEKLTTVDMYSSIFHHNKP